jgi:UDP-glucose 4-epimerase
MAPTILVTGADGFVGRHLISALTRAGWEVRRAQRSACPTSQNADIVTGLELGPSTDWQAALSGVQAVVHLAARAHRSGSVQEREKDLYFPSMSTAPCNLRAAPRRPACANSYS